MILKWIGVFLVCFSLPWISRGDILFKVGILNMDSLTEKIPEAKELKDHWDKVLNRKYIRLRILEEEKESLSAKRSPVLLSSKISLHAQIEGLNREIESLKKQREKDLAALKAEKENELKRKILLAIKSARRKKGFSMILSSKVEFILHYDSKVDFNPLIIEELTPKEEQQIQD